MKKIPYFFGITAGVLSLGMFLAPVSAGEVGEVDGTERILGAECVTPTPVPQKWSGKDTVSDMDYFLDLGGENTSYESVEIQYISSKQAISSGAECVTPTPVPQKWSGKDAASDMDYFLDLGGENTSYESVEIQYISSKQANSSGAECVTPTPVPQKWSGKDTASDMDYFLDLGGENTSYESVEIQYVPGT